MDQIEQTGFLYKFDPKDYVLGVNSPLKGEDINPSGDWVEHRPSDEKQYSFKFDTMSCSTFSGTSDLEDLANYFLAIGFFSEAQIKWCKDNGYIELNGKFNFSDRWSATSNGTMPNGQYLPAVWDDFRHVGLIPERDLPFGGDNQAEYLDKANLTPERYAKAKAFLEMMIEKDAQGKFKINYEWIPVETGVELAEALKQAPLHVAVTKENPQHAIVILRMDKEFETYPPFLRDRNRTIAYALKPIVKFRKDNPTPPPIPTPVPTPIPTPTPTPTPTTYKYFSAAEVAKWKLKPELWQVLDKIRGECGFPFIITSGLRTKAENDATKDAVSDSAHLNGLAADIYCVDSGKRDKIDIVRRKHGVTRFGLGKTFVHLDIDPTKPQNVMWHYY